MTTFSPSVLVVPACALVAVAIFVLAVRGTGAPPPTPKRTKKKAPRSLVARGILVPGAALGARKTSS